MTKAEFIDSVAAKANLSKKEAGAAVDAVLDTISGTLAGGGDVAFTGFGKFHVQSRAARTGVNPRTGEKVNIPAGKVPKFTPGSSAQGERQGQLRLPDGAGPVGGARSGLRPVPRPSVDAQRRAVEQAMERDAVGRHRLGAALLAVDDADHGLAHRGRPRAARARSRSRRRRT